MINTGNNEAILEKHFNATSPKEQKSIIEDIYDGKNQVAQERKLKAIGIPFDHLPDMPNIYFAKIAYSKLYDHTEYVNCNKQLTHSKTTIVHIGEEFTLHIINISNGDWGKNLIHLIESGKISSNVKEKYNQNHYDHYNLWCSQNFDLQQKILEI